jgi:hypothetical protein
VVNKILKALSNPILARNKNYKDIYTGEECYLFGNGISLKWFDLAKFSDKKSLTCGWLYLHKEFSKLHVVADIELHPFLFYPYWKNNYTLRWVRNPISSFLCNSGKFNCNHPVFVSLTNYLALRNYPNVKYLHHFGEKNPDAGILDLAGTFSWMKGSLYGMLGIAAFMGFKKITLVGMDYLFDIVMLPHFYENGTGNREELDAEKRDGDLKIFQQLKNKFDIDIELMLPREAISTHLPSVYYSDVFSVSENYRNNDVLVESKYLQEMSSLGLGYSI